MATPAEKKALLFLGVVTLLGGGLRLWRAHNGSENPTSQSSTVVVQPVTGAPTTSMKKEGATTAPTVSGLDDHIPIDLDIATLDELEAIGVLKPGIARMIIANRDSFGAFGSIKELERIPYLRKTTITSLAPHVTFSRMQRPSNAVLK